MRPPQAPLRESSARTIERTRCARPELGPNVKLLIVTLFALVMGSAPFQCAADPDPERRMTDSPAEALFGLSERFEAEGNEGARRTTLETIIERYPSSSEARRAREEIE